MTNEELKNWAKRRLMESLIEGGWRDAEDQFPHEGQLIETSYPGVYHNRRCHFWVDGGGQPHYGRIDEPDGKGSQPAKLWRPVS